MACNEAIKYDIHFSGMNVNGNVILKYYVISDKQTCRLIVEFLKQSSMKHNL